MGCATSTESVEQIKKRAGSKLIFIAGPHGSGKKTHCQKLAEQQKLNFVSLSEILKNESQKDTETGKKIKDCLDKHQLVDSQIVCQLLDQNVQKNDNIQLIEGFPQSMDNVNYWNKNYAQNCNLYNVIVFDCTKDELVNRLQSSGIENLENKCQQDIERHEQIKEHYMKIKKCIQVCTQRKEEKVAQQLKCIMENILLQKEIKLPEVIFVSGCLASGKRTMATQLQEKYGFEKINSKDVLKDAVESNDKNAQKIKDLMENGQFVPSELVVELLMKKIDESQNQTIVIEGFPKNLENVECWNRKMYGIVHTKMFLYFDLDKETQKQRLGEITEVVQKRIDNQEKNSKNLINYFKNLNKLFMIDCNRPAESVFRQICLYVDEQLYFKKIVLPKILFIVGGPGAGKGTQCAKMKDEFNFAHYSTGDLLREEVAKGGPLSAEIKELQDQGKLVSSDLLVDIVRCNIEFKTGVFMLDGFPRSQDNIDSWEKKMKGICTTEFLLYFECDQQAMHDRIMERAKTSGRSDDNEETISKRLDTFFSQTKPIIEYFQKQNKVVSINADRDIDPIFESVKEEINAKIINKPSSLPKVVFINGGPGSGKQTLCKKLCAKFQFNHLNVGELLQQCASKGDKTGNEVQDLILSGKLVSSEIVVDILNEKIKGKQGMFLVDGFPKSHDNSYCWYKKMLYTCDIQFLILLEATDETLLQRLQQRDSQNDEVFKKKIDIFNIQTKDFIEGFEKNGKVHKIQTNDQTEDQVFEQACKLFE